jgi:hypothetical protein
MTTAMTTASWPESVEPDCVFCEARLRPADELPWFRRPAYVAESAIVLPGVGSLTSVYVQVVTVPHVVASAGLDDFAVAGFASVLEFVVSEVAAACGGVTVFEHGGSLDPMRRRSACITHAHVHVMAGEHSFVDRVRPNRTYASLTEFLREHRSSEPYLMYSSASDGVVVAPDVGESQYFRRAMAETAGIADEWDWAVFPRWDRVRETISFFQGLAWPSAISSIS